MLLTKVGNVHFQGEGSKYKAFDVTNLSVYVLPFLCLPCCKN